MFCTNCGNKIEDTAKFCTQCGTPINQNLYNDSTSKTANPAIVTPYITEELPKKKRKITPLIIAGVCIIVLLTGGILGYIIYQNNIMKHAEYVLAYHDEGRYLEAIDLYQKYNGKKEDFDNKVFEGLHDVALRIKEDFFSEEIDFYTAIDQLFILEDYNNDELNKEIEEIIGWIYKIDASRINFYNGKYYYDEGDYIRALEYYGLVIKDDEKYYEMALKEIDSIKQEVADKEEKERIVEIKNKTLEEASEYAERYDYKMAIYVLEQGLNLIPEDKELTEKVSLYNKLYEMTIMVPSFTSSKYEYTYKEQDIDIMTVSMELPILEGDNPAYMAINEFFEDVKMQYIGSGDQLAENARFSITDEYFIPYSFDLIFNILYNHHGILCISLDGYVFTGGAHGYPIKEVFTFDLTSGSLLKLSDLITIDKEEFSNYITEEFMRMYEEAPDEYWEDAPYIVQEDTLNIDNMNFYLDDEGICIFYFPYDLGSYARGFVDIVIPYNGNRWMFRFLP